MYICLFSLLFIWPDYFLFFVDGLLDKKKEILEMMIKHGIMEGLCEIFSTSTDEDTLV